MLQKLRDLTRKVVAVTISTSTLISCGPQIPQRSDTQSSVTNVQRQIDQSTQKLNLIFGQDDRIAVSKERIENTKVGQLRILRLDEKGRLRPTNTVCTAFASGINQITTAAHCWQGEENKFHIFMDGNKKIHRVVGKVQELSNTNTVVLYTPQISQWIEPGTFDSSKTVSMVSYSKDKDILTEVSSDKPLQLDPTGTFLWSEMDSLPGASGSPVLQDGKLVAVHQGSVTLGTKPRTKKNFASLVTAVLPGRASPKVLKTRFESSSVPCESAADYRLCLYEWRLENWHRDIDAQIQEAKNSNISEKQYWTRDCIVRNMAGENYREDQQACIDDVVKHHDDLLSEKLKNLEITRREGVEAIQKEFADVSPLPTPVPTQQPTPVATPVSTPKPTPTPVTPPRSDVDDGKVDNSPNKSLQKARAKGQRSKELQRRSKAEAKSAVIQDVAQQTKESFPHTNKAQESSKTSSKDVLKDYANEHNALQTMADKSNQGKPPVDVDWADPKVAETTSVLTTEGSNEYGPALQSALGILIATGDRAAIQKLIQSALANGQTQALAAAFYAGYGTGKIAEKYIPDWNYPQEAYDAYNKSAKILDDVKSWMSTVLSQSDNPSDKEAAAETVEAAEAAKAALPPGDCNENEYEVLRREVEETKNAARGRGCDKNRVKTKEQAAANALAFDNLRDARRRINHPFLTPCEAGILVL
jgi:hypothetical protein